MRYNSHVRLLPRLPSLLFLCALAGCDKTPNEILFDNRGFQTAVVDVTYRASSSSDDWTGGEERQQLFEVAAGTIAVGEYPDIDDMDVLITRKIDGMVLFHASYTQKDFRHDHSRIEITVYP